MGGSRIQPRQCLPPTDRRSPGVYFDDPDIVPMERCRSFAGIPVALDFQVPEGYEVQEVCMPPVCIPGPMLCYRTAIAGCIDTGCEARRTMHVITLVMRFI
nr:GyrI-like domain-containing protein [Granulosicoccus antarcticus]